MARDCRLVQGKAGSCARRGVRSEGTRVSGYYGVIARTINAPAGPREPLLVEVALGKTPI